MSKRWKVVKEKPPKPQKEKRKTKFSKKTISAIALLVACVASLIWAAPNLPHEPNASSAPTYQGVVELWNVELFEGGSGSRASWLTRKAAQLEKSNKGLFVHVTTLTLPQLEQKLQQNQAFDVVCFSRGAGHLLLPYLAPLGYDGGAFDNLLLSAQVGGKQYALPLYAGVYCLFARQNQVADGQSLLSQCLTATFERKVGKNTFHLQPLLCGFGAFNSPLSALAQQGAKGDVGFVDQNATQYAAYEQFVGNKKAVTLLGTQRDLYRLGQKQQQGKIDGLLVEPLAAFTDLVQYVGVSANSGAKSAACNKFVQFLLSAEAQNTLVEVNMFSATQSNLYTTEHYQQCQRQLPHAYVPNLFADQTSLLAERQNAVSALRG